MVGRGVDYGTAFEAALKIYELTGGSPPSRTRPADFLHGPIAIARARLPDARDRARPARRSTAMRELLDAARERGADVTVISDAAAARAPARPVEPVPEWLSPLVAVIPAQLLAVGAAERLGLDVDRPTGLQKVTLTS